MDENADVKLALEEMRLLMQSILTAGDTLDQKANTLLSAAGTVVAIFAALQVITTGGHLSVPRTILIGLAALLYAGMIALGLAAAAPSEYRGPIAPSRDTLRDRVFDKPERTAILAVLSGYVVQINHNEDVNARKAWKVRIGYWLLPAIILILVVAAAVP